MCHQVHKYAFSNPEYFRVVEELASILEHIGREKRIHNLEDNICPPQAWLSLGTLFAIGNIKLMSY